MMIFALTVNAQMVGSVGFSFNKHAKDPGITAMYGTQTALDSDKDIFVRVIYSKVNWGSDIDVLDNIGIMQITYFNLPFWNNDNLPFRCGYYVQLGYETDDGDGSGAVGIEFNKQLFFDPISLSVFAGANAVYFPDPDDVYFMLTIGTIFKLK